MLRARLPLAIATVAAGIALIPTATASAATPLDGTPLGSLLGGTSTSSGTPDVQGSLTSLASCLQGTTSASPTPTATTTTSPTPTTTSPITIPTTTQTNTASAQSQQQPATPAPTKTSGLDPNSLVQQAAAPATILAGPISTITTPLTAGQQCVEDFFTALGAPQAQCFSENGLTADTLDEELGLLASGSTPDPTAVNITGLLSCLTAQSTAPTSGGGGAAVTDSPTPSPTVTSDVAPAAVAVTGTPNFTG